MRARQAGSAVRESGQSFCILRVRAQKSPVAAILINQYKRAVQMREPAAHQLLRCESFLFGIVENQMAKRAEQMRPAPLVLENLLQKDLHLQTVINQRLVADTSPETLD